MEFRPLSASCGVVIICAPFAWYRLRGDAKEAVMPVRLLKNVRDLFEQGYKEVTLLGQNVDSYYWIPILPLKVGEGETVTFANLLERVALIDPALRVRFSTSHPKDITDDVLLTMAKYENICRYIHLPVQSGSTRVLQLMNRTYTREWYMAKVNRIRKSCPTAASVQIYYRFLYRNGRRPSGYSEY